MFSPDALGIVCNVIQLVQIGIDLAKRTSEVRKQGTTNVELEESTKALAAVYKTLKDDLAKPNTAVAADPSENQLRELAEKCSESASQLLQQLEKLRIQPGSSKRAAFGAAFKSKFKQDAVQELQRKLELYRRVLETDVLLKVSRQSKEMSQSQLHGFATLAADTQTLISSLQRSQTSVKDLHQLIQNSSQELQVRIADESQAIQRKLDDDIARQQFLQGLSFAQMNDRRLGLINAEQGMYSWIFDDEPRPSGSKCDFKEWLRSGANLYWISGKAASGKSTLVNTLAQSTKTKDTLQIWAGHERVLILTHFFWKPGSLMEKNFAGLLRSVLYQVVRACPEAWPLLCNLSAMTLSNVEVSHQLWTQDLLVSTLQSLLSNEALPVKFCMFVDGLDEFEEDTNMLIAWIHRISALPKVKICASSRPLRRFQLAFDQAPTLRLQDLNKHEIDVYIEQTFEKHFASHPSPSLEAWITKDIRKHISDAADGVFLWVVLAVRSVLEGLLNEDSQMEIETRLKSLPTELDALYTQMLAPTLKNKAYLKEAATYLALVHSATIMNYEVSIAGIISVLKCAASCELDLAAAAQKKQKPVSADDLLNKCKTTRTRISTLCMGLLDIREISDEGHIDAPGSLLDDEFVRQFCNFEKTKVSFLHRSALDFLRESQTASALHLPPGQQFVLHAQTILKLFVMLGEHYKHVDAKYMKGLLLMLKHVVEMACKHCEALPISLIESINPICANTFGQDRDRDGVAWYNIIEEPSYLVKDFEGIAAKWGLYDFIRLKLCDKMPGQDRLDYLLRCYMSRDDHWPYKFTQGVECALFLMELGASPNVKYADQEVPDDDRRPWKRTATPWTLFIGGDMCRLSTGRIRLIGKDQRRNLARLTRCFVEHGADLETIGRVDLEIPRWKFPQTIVVKFEVSVLTYLQLCTLGATELGQPLIESLIERGARPYCRVHRVSKNDDTDIEMNDEQAESIAEAMLESIQSNNKQLLSNSNLRERLRELFPTLAPDSCSDSSSDGNGRERVVNKRLRTLPRERVSLIWWDE